MITYGVPTSAPEAPRLDYDGSGNLLYLGYSAAGASTAEALWQIRKFEYDGSGNLTAIKYANGLKEFDQIWDNRSSLTYA